MKFSSSVVTLAVLALGAGAFPTSDSCIKPTVVCSSSADCCPGFVCDTSDEGHNFCRKIKPGPEVPRALPGDVFKRAACKKNGERCTNSRQCCKGYCFDLTSTCVNH